MGFLDHSTNNIIVDAVLTDAGRRALSRNDGSFQVYSFCLGDDEVDYSIITKYGQTVGKEKIEKNTPIMEALTAGSLGLKNKLVSINNDYLAFFPKMTINMESEDVSGTTPTFTRTGTGPTDRTQTMTIKTAPSDTSQDIDPQLVDRMFRVELNHLFLKVSEDQPDIIYTDNIAVYEIDASAGSGSTVSTVEFDVTLKGMTSSTFNIYSVGGNYIKTYIKVTGNSSGITQTFPVLINS